MKIYIISQDKNQGYDTYDSAVVVAPNEEYAMGMYPGNGNQILDIIKEDKDPYALSSWVTSPLDVKCQLIGFSNIIQEPLVMCASFNAG